MLCVIITLIFNMFTFSCSPRNQQTNYGRKAGKKSYKLPMQDRTASVTAAEDFSSVSQFQVTSPFPSHSIFDAAHPPWSRGSAPTLLSVLMFSLTQYNNIHLTGNNCIYLLKSPVFSYKNRL